MRIPRIAPRPARRLADLTTDAAVLTTGALGFLDAADEDRVHWAAGFRGLLDGVDSPLQVIVDFVPGGGGRQGDDVAPPVRDHAGWRALDLDFERQLAGSADAQRRAVYLVVPPAQVPGLRRSLVAMSVPDVEAMRWEPDPALAFGEETAQSLHDGDGWHRTFFVDRFPGAELEPGWLLQLVPADLRVTVGWHAERLPTSWVVDYLQRQLVNMRAAALHRSEGSVDPHLTGAMPAVEELQQQLVSGRENAFFVSVYLTVTTADRAGLAGASQRVEAAARSTLCRLLPCDFRQLEGRLCTLPLGRNPLRRTRMLHSAAVTTLFPWFDAELRQPGGLVLGCSRATGRPVMVDPFDERAFPNANIGVFGHSGAGKTYLLSLLTMGALGLDTQVFVIDPEHEYGRLARLLGGLDVNLALGSGHSINVLDMRGRGVGESLIGPAVADTVDLCGTICGGLDEAERAALETAIRRTFETVPDPVLGDVACRLDPASRAGVVLGRWVQGSLGQMFSRPTNVDLDAPLIVFGMRELRAEMVAPVHYLLAEALWARIKTRDRRRLLVVDELGLLFEDPTIRQFVVALARRIRKYDGSLVFATQNPGDLLASEAGRVVATNPAIHFFGALRPGEAATLQAAFSLSDAQRGALEVARRGQFLLAAGQNRLPLNVVAPPWQAAAMQRAREPP